MLRAEITCPHCTQRTTVVLGSERFEVRHPCVARDLGVRWEGAPGEAGFKVFAHDGIQQEVDGWRVVEGEEPLHAQVVEKLRETDGNRIRVVFTPGRPVF